MLKSSWCKWCAVVVTMVLIGVGISYSQPTVKRFDVGDRMQLGDISNDGRIVAFAGQCFRCPESFNHAFIYNTATDEIKKIQAVNGNGYSSTVTGPLDDGSGVPYYMVYSGDWGAQGRCPCSIFSYNTKTGARAEIKTGSYMPYGSMEVTRDGKQLYYVDWSRASRGLRGLDTATGQENFYVSFDNFVAFKFALSSDEKTAYVSGLDRSTNTIGIRITDLATKAVTASIGTDLQIGDTDFGMVAISANGSKLIVSEGVEGGSKVAVIDLGTRDVAVVDVGGGPFGVAVSPDGKTAYVGHMDSKDIWILDLTTTPVTVKSKIDAACDVVDLEISPDGQTLYAGCMEGNAILKITGF